MKRLLALLVPVVLFAQVEVDTIIHLPSFVMNGHFIPELNKLYLVGCYEHVLLDCASYQVLARIPRSYDNSYGYTSWNHRRQKLYVGFNPAPDSLVAIDMGADSLVATIPRSGSANAFVATSDRLYRGVDHNLIAMDCATDTVVRVIPPPESSYVFSHPTWDSVSNKLYVSLGSWELQSKIAVYDCSSDSLLSLIDVPGTGGAAGRIHIEPTYRKGYFASANPWATYAGVIDVESDTLIKFFPINTSSFYDQVAVDTTGHKVYIAGRDTNSGTTVAALFVVDCATDSIVKRLTFPLTPWPIDFIRWVPWSDRVYLTRTAASAHQNIGMIVVDCRTDTVIEPNLVLGYWPPYDFQIDPIRKRVFAIGCESTTVHVLRDTGYGGVAEALNAEVRAANPKPTIVRGVLLVSGVPSRKPQASNLMDATGRRVMDLRVGANDVRALAPGVYFIREGLGTRGEGSGKTLKVVVTR